MRFRGFVAIGTPFTLIEILKVVSNLHKYCNSTDKYFRSGREALSFAFSVTKTKSYCIPSSTCLVVVEAMVSSNIRVEDDGQKLFTALYGKLYGDEESEVYDLCQLDSDGLLSYSAKSNAVLVTSYNTSKPVPALGGGLLISKDEKIDRLYNHLPCASTLEGLKFLTYAIISTVIYRHLPYSLVRSIGLSFNVSVGRTYNEEKITNLIIPKKPSRFQLAFINYAKLKENDIKRFRKRYFSLLDKIDFPHFVLDHHKSHIYLIKVIDLEKFLKRAHSKGVFFFTPIETDYEAMDIPAFKDDFDSRQWCAFPMFNYNIKKIDKAIQAIEKIFDEANL